MFMEGKFAEDFNAQAILSRSFYLDHLGNDWEKWYKEGVAASFIGAKACSWSEHVNENNIDGNFRRAKSGISKNFRLAPSSSPRFQSRIAPPAPLGPRVPLGISRRPDAPAPALRSILFVYYISFETVNKETSLECNCVAKNW